VFQTISGGYFTTAGNSILENRMLATLAREAPNIDTEAVISAGASGIWQAFSGDDLEAVIKAYMVGIKDVFAFMLACAVCSVLLTFLVPLKKIPVHNDKKPEDVEAAPEGEKEPL
jgi:MFS transporter, DHA2 family, glioxin efflux transporter